jgi:hypothetical protein
MGSEGIAPLILYLGTRWIYWSAPRPGHFTSGERAPSTPWVRGCEGPITDLEKKQVSSLPGIEKFLETAV